ncbi:hypothetical protein AVEN_140998-1, partial [Araneus ventricosus]
RLPPNDGPRNASQELKSLYIQGATKVPYHPFNYQMAAAIFIRVMSRHGKVTMRYWMKPLTASPGGKRWS